MAEESIPIPTWLLYELADDSPLKGLGSGRSLSAKLSEMFGPGQLEIRDSVVLPFPEELMPAPKLKLHDNVVARDGSKGVVTKTIDLGESGPVKYVVKFENGKEATLAESEIALAPVPAAPAAAKAAKAPDGAATPAEGAAATPSDQGSDH